MTTTAIQSLPNFWWKFKILNPCSTTWFNASPLCNDLSSFYACIKLFKLHAGSKSGSSAVFVDTYKISRYVQIPLLKSVLSRSVQRLKQASVKSIPPVHTLHPLPKWSSNALSFLTHHKLVGHFPLKVIKGETTSSYSTLNPNSFKKRRRRRIRRRKIFKLSQKLTQEANIYRFKSYLRRKLSTLDIEGEDATLLYNRLITLKVTKRLKSRSKSKSRFKPYRFLGLKLPLRLFEAVPTFFFQSKAETFHKTLTSSKRYLYQNLYKKRPSSISLTPIRTRIASFRKLIEFNFKLLPRRLKPKLRWSIRNNLASRVRKRQKLYITQRDYTLNGSYAPSTQLKLFNCTSHLKKFKKVYNFISRPQTHSVLLPSRRAFRKLLSKTRARKKTNRRKKTRPIFIRPQKISRNLIRSRFFSIILRKLGYSLRFKASITQSIRNQSSTTFRNPLQVARHPSSRFKAVVRRAFDYLNWVNYPSPRLNPNLTRPQLIGVRALQKPKPNFFKFNSFKHTKKFPSSSFPYPVTHQAFQGNIFFSPICDSLKTRIIPKVTTPLIRVFTSPSSPSPLLGKPLELSPVAVKRLPLFLKNNHNSLGQTTPCDDSIFIVPTHSKLFRRSLFFFVNLLIRPSTVQLDLMTSTSQVNPVLNYNVFPDANHIKVAAFRRLGKQKSLYDARTTLFNAFEIPKFYKDFMPTTESKSILKGYTSSLQALWRKQTLPRHRTPTPYTNIHLLSRKEPQLLKVQRVRFKPGYGRIWRLARTSIREIAGLPSRYQYRLTPKLGWLYKQERRTGKPYSSVNLDYLLMSSHLVPDLWVMNSLFDSNSIYLNGALTYNSHLKVFLNDFIQLIISLKFFITLKWLRNWSEARQNRVTRVFYSKYRPSGTDKSFRFARPLPEWFFDLRFAYRAIPQNVEVDFFTLSIFVIHDKLIADPTEPIRANLYNSTILNMYNWKYIT